ncbi:MAG: tRNA (adenosine(37)-N6)-threonylcarbamoyltransferase complex dimerization subunit type 1 TsaB [Planctomycetota bacterium]
MIERPFLALETSTRNLSIAIGSDGQTLDEVALDPAASHASDLGGACHRLLERHRLTPRDLAGLAVGIGPGSFTGLRVAAALALGLERACGVPLYGIPSLTAALLEVDPLPPGVHLSLVDARAGRVYASLHDDQPLPRVLAAADAPRLEDFEAFLEQLPIDAPLTVHAEPRTLELSRGTRPLGEALTSLHPTHHIAPAPTPTAKGVLRLACDPRANAAPLPRTTLRPLYLARFGPTKTAP